MMRAKTILFLLVFAYSGFAVAQQQYGTLDGTVTDEQGGVLPGTTVTITSPALIGGAQTAVTGMAGRYFFRNLAPGIYTIQFEMAGFAPYTREGIILRVATTTTVDAQMVVGGIEESITVTGESPVVDVRSTITQTNVDNELYDAVPTGRNPWVMAGLVPGVVAGRLDVGGTEGMQQYGLEVFGSEDSQKSFSIDGLKTNWTGGGGGSTMQYYDFGMYEEYNFQTASGTAESDVAGVYMNMVTRSGGNDFQGSSVIYFMNESMQSQNVEEELQSNPVKISYDFNTVLGGPIVTDKAWFFGSFRWWRLDKYNLGVVNPDGSRGVDDNRIINGMGKVTLQATSDAKFSFMFNRNQKTRFHRGDDAYPFAEEKATSIQDQPAQNFVADYSHVLGTSGLFNIRFGRMWGTYPQKYQDAVTDTDYCYQDPARGTRWNAYTSNFEDPNSRWQANGSYSHFLDHSSGTHDLKFGFQASWESTEYQTTRNGDVVISFDDGVPDTVALYNSPVLNQVLVNTWGAYIQDSWIYKQRLTLNIGVRMDGIQGESPDQSSPAGTFAPERHFERETGVPDWPINVAPRMGFSYDLFGDGKTAIKGYYGRFYSQIGATFPYTVNRNGGQSSTVDWNDLNGNLLLDPGPSGTFADSPELGPFQGFEGGATTSFDHDATRPYSDEFNFGVSHTLAPNLSLGVSYHRRQLRNGMAKLDQARPPSAYDPISVTYDDPVDGPNQTITVYELKPEYVGLRDSIFTNYPDLKSNYNGVHIQMTKRMSNRWQLLAGLTLQKHTGLYPSGTYTSTDFNNPNRLTNSENARIFTDIPWVFTLSGSYLLPYDIMLAGKYTGREGDPLQRQLRVSGLNQSSETIQVVPRGVDRGDAVTSFIDIRFNKVFDIGARSRIEAMVDIFNLLNSDTYLLYQQRIGSAWGTPQRILSPRIVRFGFRISY